MKRLNWPLTIIISILAGWLGVDRFMMGQWFWGFVKLLTGGGFGIWWFIDIILIAAQYEFENVEWVD